MSPWFAPNRAGFGYHPQTWQGYLILIGAVAVIVCVVVFVRLAMR